MRSQRCAEASFAVFEGAYLGRERVKKRPGLGHREACYPSRGTPPVGSSSPRKDVEPFEGQLRAPKPPKEGWRGTRPGSSFRILYSVAPPGGSFRGKSRL